MRVDDMLAVLALLGIGGLVGGAVPVAFEFFRRKRWRRR